MSCPSRRSTPGSSWQDMQVVDSALLERYQVNVGGRSRRGQPSNRPGRRCDPRHSVPKSTPSAPPSLLHSPALCFPISLLVSLNKTFRSILYNLFTLSNPGHRLSSTTSVCSHCACLHHIVLGVVMSVMGSLPGRNMNWRAT